MHFLSSIHPSHHPLVPNHYCGVQKYVSVDYDMNLLTQLVGTLTKTLQSNKLIWRTNMTCTKCNYTSSVLATYDQFYKLSSPVLCPNTESYIDKRFKEETRKAKRIN